MVFIRTLISLSVMLSLSMGIFLSPTEAMLHSSDETLGIEEGSQYFQYGHRHENEIIRDSQNSQDSQLRQINQIYLIKEVEEKIRSLRNKGVQPEEICVVLDFHGVIVEQEQHQPPLTLKGNIKEFLQYVKAERIPNLVATAWDRFDDVIKDGFKTLELQDFFDVNAENETSLNYHTLGPNKTMLEGYQNGRVVALRSSWSIERYFRRKALAIELIYPQHQFQYILFVDDSKDNLRIFEDDTSLISHTRWKNFQDLFLYQLMNDK